MLPAPKKRLWKGLGEAAVVTGESRLVACEPVVVLVVLVCGARERYFCFTSSVVNVAPVLRMPEPVELSELVLDSEEALRPPGACTSVDVRRLQKQTIHWSWTLMLMCILE